MAARRLISVEPLTPAAFAPFGTVIQNPSTVPESSRDAVISPIFANQGTATKYADICGVENHYHLASSRAPGRIAMSMFVCSPRTLRASAAAESEHGQSVFDVDILERHPFTTQTFIPMGLAARDPATQYLVIVAPTARTSPSRIEILARPQPYPGPDKDDKRSKRSRASEKYSRARPRPYDNDNSPPSSVAITAPAAPWSSSHSMRKVPSQTPVAEQQRRRPKGTGPPDLTGLRAFVAYGNQAVTYGAGTWHAPMVVLGQDAVDFVVLQYVNGMSNDDCQETEFSRGSDGQAHDLVAVAIQQHTSSRLQSKI